MQRRLAEAMNRSINNWFHGVRPDGLSPEISICTFSNLFLAAVKRMGFNLTCNEYAFRRYLCEALCVIFSASKQKTGWEGPKSMAPRPETWTNTNEHEWRDLLRSMYFSYSFFESLWEQVGDGEWEKSIPFWRISMENIVLHYIVVVPEMLEGGDAAAKESTVTNSGEHAPLTDAFDDYYY